MGDRTRGTGPTSEEAGAALPAADVISLHAATQNARFPALAQLEEYWQSLRGTRLVPARSEVDPRKIEDTLEYAFIAERIAPGMARFRVAGMHMNDLMGMEVRGMPVSAFFTPDAREALSQALERVFNDPAIARLTLHAETGRGRPDIEAQLLLLPLKNDFGDVTRALGCMVTHGGIGRTPRRFAISTTQIDAVAGPEHEGDRRIGGFSSEMGRGLRRRDAHLADGFNAKGPNAPARQHGSLAGGGQSRPESAPTVSPPPRVQGRPNLYIVHSAD